MGHIGKPLSHNNSDNESNKFADCNGEVVVKTSLCQETGTTIDVEFSVSGTQVNVYNEINSLAGLATSDIINYIIPIGKTFKINNINFSGENKSVFLLSINGITHSKFRTYFNDYNGTFNTNNLIFNAGDNIKVIAENKRNSVSDYNANIQGVLDDA
jgi:hypothetical protein